MTKIVSVKCDGQGCRRVVSSDIHAGTWITVQFGAVFGTEGDQYEIEPRKHFCGYYCLYKHSCKVLSFPEHPPE